MNLGLKGKVAIVTASSKGLGKASTLALAMEGATVVIGARDEKILKKPKEKYKKKVEKLSWLFQRMLLKKVI